MSCNTSVLKGGASCTTALIAGALCRRSARTLRPLRPPPSPHFAFAFAAGLKPLASLAASDFAFAWAVFAARLARQSTTGYTCSGCYQTHLKKNLFKKLINDNHKLHTSSNQILRNSKR